MTQRPLSVGDPIRRIEAIMLSQDRQTLMMVDRIVNDRFRATTSDGQTAMWFLFSMRGKSWR